MVTTIIYYQQQHNLLSFVGSLFVRILCSFKPSLPPTILHPPEMMFMIMTMMGEREGMICNSFCVHDVLYPVLGV